jgi:predicted HAD superfamily Cof-like phosphohydrolase
MLREWHEHHGVPVGEEPAVPAEARVRLRHRLLEEEAIEALELLSLMADGITVDLAALAKELCDVVVVAYGCALEFGLDLDAAMVAVHRSNMVKNGGVREDGKILKGPGYRAPTPEELVVSLRPVHRHVGSEAETAERVPWPTRPGVLG